MALHHLGLDQLGRRVDRDPVESVGPDRVTEESRVVCSRSLKQEKHKEQGEERSIRFMRRQRGRSCSPQTRPQWWCLCPPQRRRLSGLLSSPSGPELGWTSLSGQRIVYGFSRLKSQTSILPSSDQKKVFTLCLYCVTNQYRLLVVKTAGSDCCQVALKDFLLLPPCFYGLFTRSIR